MSATGWSGGCTVAMADVAFDVVDGGEEGDVRLLMTEQRDSSSSGVAGT